MKRDSEVVPLFSFIHSLLIAGQPIKGDHRLQTAPWTCRERERERERGGGRQRERQRETEVERHRKREIERDRERQG